ncbi:MAG TPA: glycosyltransferase [Candidatus Binataceae bacterium]|nr:glycosyltransferase [Candidatus Binataceae bacterium]
MNPEVSVVIPTYNRAAMVREAALSVLAQRGVDYELIVIDDGSTDGTAGDLARLREESGGQVRIERIENSGVAAARNRGVALARAPLVAFLDSDDLWMPDKLARQLDFMRAHPECEVSQCQERWIRGGRRVNPGYRHRKRGGDLFFDSLRTCLISPSAVIMRIDLFRALGGFDETMRACEDYDLWLRILVTREIGLLDEVLLERRAGHPDQLSAAVAALDRYRILGLVKLLTDSRLSDSRRDTVTQVLAEKCAIYANGLRRRDRADAALYIERVGAQALGDWRGAPGESIAIAAAELRNLVNLNVQSESPPARALEK